MTLCKISGGSGTVGAGFEDLPECPASLARDASLHEPSAAYMPGGPSLIEALPALYRAGGWPLLAAGIVAGLASKSETFQTVTTVDPQPPLQERTRPARIHRTVASSDDDAPDDAPSVKPAVFPETTDLALRLGYCAMPLASVEIEYGGERRVQRSLDQYIDQIDRALRPWRDARDSGDVDPSFANSLSGNLNADVRAAEVLDQLRALQNHRPATHDSGLQFWRDKLSVELGDVKPPTLQEVARWLPTELDSPADVEIAALFTKLGACASPDDCMQVGELLHRAVSNRSMIIDIQLESARSTQQQLLERGNQSDAAIYQHAVARLTVRKAELDAQRHALPPRTEPQIEASASLRVLSSKPDAPPSTLLAVLDDANALASSEDPKVRAFGGSAMQVILKAQALLELLEPRMKWLHDPRTPEARRMALRREIGDFIDSTVWPMRKQVLEAEAVLQASSPANSNASAISVEQRQHYQMIHHALQEALMNFMQQRRVLDPHHAANARPGIDLNIDHRHGVVDQLIDAHWKLVTARAHGPEPSLERELKVLDDAARVVEAVHREIGFLSEALIRAKTGARDGIEGRDNADWAACYEWAADQISRRIYDLSNLIVDIAEAACTRPFDPPRPARPASSADFPSPTGNELTIARHMIENHRYVLEMQMAVPEETVFSRSRRLLSELGEAFHDSTVRVVDPQQDVDPATGRPFPRR